MKKTVTFACIGVVALIGAATLQRTAYLESTKDLTLAEPQPLVDTYDLMDLIFDPTYESLKEAVSVEPEGRREWRAIYIHAYVMGELANLLFARNDHEYMTTKEWDDLVIEMRRLADNIGEATKAKDYPAAKSNYEALVANCNACHTKFEPEDATEVKVWD